MAFFFQLAVECGASHGDALRIGEHFDGYTLHLASEKEAICCVDTVDEDQTGNWWVSVLTNMGDTFLETTSQPIVRAQVAEKLYERLRSASGYRFALVGIEVFQFNRVDALRDLFPHTGLVGSVLSEELFHEFGRPAGFVSFSAGHVWLPVDFGTHSA